MNTKKIVITGGPGTGKSSIIKQLKQLGYTCFEEISRQVTLDAQKAGIDQLFLSDPLLFSERLITGRKEQFKEAENSNKELVFLDRGVHDVLAYMDFKGEEYPEYFKIICQNCIYDFIFILKPWESIYQMDNERYESFEQAVAIHDHLLKTYRNFNYNLMDVPFDSVERRADHIIQTLNSL